MYIKHLAVSEQLLYPSPSFLILLHQWMSKLKCLLCSSHLNTGSKPEKIYWMKICLHLVFQEVVLKSIWHKTEGDLCIFVWLLFFQLLDMRFSNEKVLQKYGGSFPSLRHPWGSSGFRLLLSPLKQKWKKCNDDLVWIWPHLAMEKLHDFFHL